MINGINEVNLYKKWKLLRNQIYKLVEPTAREQDILIAIDDILSKKECDSYKLGGSNEVPL